MDLMCVIVMQTTGNTLVMDWTHRTNTLGYHLGCPMLIRILLCMLLTTLLVALLVVVRFTK
ncbi:Hypothetical protein PHPALM_11612 [Phytophthora palmivora]|uniref:Uncharacterized protein n=1 Tax=Phytophthora palmivora TaxID=4796 RepID=A0A2P4Y1T5_9STRA|nr:Hypothetical protein PHPALM_11612 [Phytophthora palmivora]